VRPPGAVSPSGNWKVNLGSSNSSCSNGSWRSRKGLRKLYPRTTWRMDLRQMELNAHLRWVHMHANFFVCGPKFTNFLRPTPGVLFDQLLFRFLICRSVPEIGLFARPKSKVVKTCAEFWTIFALPNFCGRAFQKLYPCYHLCHAVRRLEKFHEDILIFYYFSGSSSFSILSSFIR